MTYQLIVPLHTALDGPNTESWSQFSLGFANMVKADIQLLSHIVTFPSVSAPFAKMVVDLPRLTAEVQRDCRKRAAGFLELLRARSAILSGTSRACVRTAYFTPTAPPHPTEADLSIPAPSWISSGRTDPN